MTEQSNAPAYAELHCHSYFSLLDGCSSPEVLVAEARALGLQALALTDHDSLAGAVRFALAARPANLHAILGSEVMLAPLQAGAPPHHLTLLAETQAGYANLCRLVSASRCDVLPPIAEDETPPANWPGKTPPLLTWERLAQHTEGIIALSGCARGPIAAPLVQGDIDGAQVAARRLRTLYAGKLYVELQHHSRGGDDLLVRRLVDVAHKLDLPLVATHNAHYATHAESRLRDALLAIDANLPLTAARRQGLLPATSMAHLQSAQAMARRFAGLPQALANTLVIAERCQASIDFAQHRLPAFLAPDSAISEFTYLYQLCHANLNQRYPDLRPAVLTQLAHELDVIERAHLAGYFLIVWDLVRFARERGIRCQGRGSAANSIVAYLLGITSIDPLAHNLLFERFLSDDRHTTPDIDIDFAADRREEVIQYCYRRYGRAHTAMVCNVVTYRARSALRDLGKVLEFPEAVIDRLATGLESHAPSAAADHLVASVQDAGEGAQPDHPLLLLAELLRGLDGCPRHLSIHSGGMLITGPPLTSLVPVEPATMAGRVVAQWDKDSCEDAGLVKIDLLGLGMLGAISEAVAQAEFMGEPTPDLARLPLDDPEIYAFLRRGDTIGAFQVESRAQQQMLPRLLPERFEDIVVQVAIVRPGPIQGGAVHPYLRRRAGLEPVTYLHPVLAPVLEETLGVLLFQEQVLRVAVAAAGFSPGEADLLRRALARKHSEAAMAAMRKRFLEGALPRGLDEATAAAIFGLLEGFAGYGFPKSHAASFALIAYQSMWLKCYRPVAFYAALLNLQPMGFYPIEVLAGDARRHGVDLLAPDVTRSNARYTPERMEPGESGRWALRTGLAGVADMGDAAVAQVLAARAAKPFADLADFCTRTRLDRDVVTSLIRAGACDAFTTPRGDRRALLWRLGEIDFRPAELPIPMVESHVTLPELEPLERTLWEYELLGLTPGVQLMEHYRAALRKRRISATWEVKQMARGGRAHTAGLVAIRQRPQTAQGIVFMSLEDESGLLDVVVKPDVWARLRPVLKGALLLYIEGEVQRSGLAVSLLVQDAAPLLELLDAAPSRSAGKPEAAKRVQNNLQRSFF